MAHVFRFAHTWPVPADPIVVYGVLAAADSYDGWWPQVRRVRRIDDDSGEVDVRSLLPFTLRLVLHRREADPRRGHLRVGIEGDLQGWAQWEVRPGGGGTVADFRQQVVLAKPGLARAARLGGPVLRANHSWMMASGRRGLVAHLRDTSHIVTES